MKKASVPLSVPIKRGNKDISSVELRAPDAGTLRGLKVVDVLQMDVTQHTVLIPRISNITAPEFEQLSKDSLSDAVEVMREVTYFFV